MHATQAVRAIYCIGRNFGAHARELGNAIPTSPVVFLKSPSAIRGPAESGRIAYPDETFHHEVELVLHIGSSPAPGEKNLLRHVDQIALGLDLTRREVQNRLKKEGLPWTEAKSFKGAAVLSSFVPLIHRGDPVDTLTRLEAADFTLWVNGERRQHGAPREMTFNLEIILGTINDSHGLFPGDIIYTGTPEGVGPLRVGDGFRLELNLDGKRVINEDGML